MAKTKTESKGGNGTKCPITKEQFHQTAKPLMVTIGDRPMVADVKEFSTGNLGYYCGGPTMVTIDGVPCKAQVSLSVVLIGSKDAAE